MAGNLFLYDLKHDFVLNDLDNSVAVMCDLGVGQGPAGLELF